MGLRTQQLKGLTGGLNATACPRDLETQDGPTQSPDLLNCFALPGTVFSRLGSAPWWDTGGTGPLYWFSLFTPLTLGDMGYTTIDGTGWQWPTAPTNTAPSPRRPSYSFRILSPADGALNVNPEAEIPVTWEKLRGALAYTLAIADFDTGERVLYYPECPYPSYDVPVGRLARSKKYIIKVWAILAKSPEGAATQLEQTSNTRTFTTKLTVPTGLAPVGSISTLTPTLTCDAVTKALRYRVKIYDATGTTVLHTSSALLLPSYPVGAGVLSSGTTYKWTFTAYPDTTATADYGVESEKASIMTNNPVPESCPWPNGGLAETYTASDITFTDSSTNVRYTQVGSQALSLEWACRWSVYSTVPFEHFNNAGVSQGIEGCTVSLELQAGTRWILYVTAPFLSGEGYRTLGSVPVGSYNGTVNTITLTGTIT